jgi:hypothetical protein
LIGGQANGKAAAVVVDDDQWHLVAVVHDAATMSSQMYVDGVAIGTPQASGTAYNNVDVTIGARRNSSSNTGWGWAVTGEIDDARIYARELTPEELMALYLAGPG